MFKPKIWITISVILLIINTFLLVFLWWGKKPPLMPRGGAKDYLIKELSLTNSQIKEYDQLREEHMSTIQKLNENTHRLKDNMFDHLSAINIDTNKVNRLLQQIGENETAKDSITFYHFRTLRSILDKDQQQKFDKVIKNVLRMMAPQHGPRMRDPAGAATLHGDGLTPMEAPPPGSEPPGNIRP
jgi:Spy/CpxP family protein refolding chaperone